LKLNLRNKYVKIILDNIFEYGSDIIDLPDNNGYVEFIADIIRFFPIHNQITNLMKELYMEIIKYDLDGGEIIIYGDPRKYDENWWYTFFDSDDILEFVKGNFNFQMALECEDSDAGQDTFKTLVSVTNYKVYNMYIDMENQDVWLIKDGVKQW